MNEHYEKYLKTIIADAVIPRKEIGPLDFQRDIPCDREDGSWKIWTTDNIAPHLRKRDDIQWMIAKNNGNGYYISYGTEMVLFYHKSTETYYLCFREYGDPQSDVAVFEIIPWGHCLREVNKAYHPKYSNDPMWRKYDRFDEIPTEGIVSEVYDMIGHYGFLKNPRWIR